MLIFGLLFETEITHIFVCSSNPLKDLGLHTHTKVESEFKNNKLYQQCDIEDDKENFAGGTSEVSPVEFEAAVAKMVKECQPVLLWSRRRGTGTERHRD